MKQKFAFSDMDHLPDEIILQIFDYSSGYDLATSFQRVCTRWKYLINRYDKIWRGNVKLKGLTERKCRNKLCEVLKKTPKLKYLQIGDSGNRNWTADRTTEDILKTIRAHNEEIEYLHVIDRYPLFDLIGSVLNRNNFRRLKITINKLCDRREKIKDLKRIFGHLPDVDDFCIDFCQRIQFHCEKKNVGWKISHDFEADAMDDFA